MKTLIKKADVLIEALPYIRQFRGKLVVIKYGGSAMGGAKIRRGILEDIAFMHVVGMRPVLVHGGGPEISARMRERGKKVEFVDGFRVTDADTVQIIEETFDALSDQLLGELRVCGCDAVALQGSRDRLIKAKKHAGSQDVGFVGEIMAVDPSVVLQVMGEKIPVVSPMAYGDDHRTYNVNADLVASELAGALKAAKLVLLTDVQGILRDLNEEESLIPTIHVNEVQDLIDRKIIQSGMIPKVKACIAALSQGVEKTHIIDARLPHSLLLEIFTTKGIGTEIIGN